MVAKKTTKKCKCGAPLKAGEKACKACLAKAKKGKK